jgi:hypothetical protein
MPLARSLSDNIGYTSDLVVSLITIGVLVVAPQGLVGLGTALIRRMRNAKIGDSAILDACQQMAERVKGRA